MKLDDISSTSILSFDYADLKDKSKLLSSLFILRD